MASNEHIEPSALRARQRNMVVLLGTTLIIVGLRYMWWQLLPLHLRNLGASDAQVGTVFTVMLLLGLTQYVGGLISDRLGRRFAIALPSLVLVPILIAGSLASHWLWLAATIWLVGIVSGVQQPGFQALLAESSTDSDRGRVFGGFYTILALATMLGPATGAAFLPVLGIKGLILATAAGALLSGLARLLLLREGQFAADDAEADGVTIQAVLHEPFIWRLVVIHGLYQLLLSLTLYGPFVALHAADSLGMDPQAVNVLFAAGGIGATLTALVGGGLADRIGGRKSAAALLTGHTLLLLAWAGLNVVRPASYAIFVLSWMTAQAGVVGYVSWYSALAPTAIRGRVLGLVGAAATVFSALGPQVGAWLRGTSQSLAGRIGIQTVWARQMASGTPFLLALATAVGLAVLVVGMPSRRDLAALAEPPVKSRPAPPSS